METTSLLNATSETLSPELSNSSCNCQVEKAAIFTVLGLLSFSIVSINCFVLYLISTRRSLRSTTNICLASLSCSDLLAGLCAIPLVISCTLQTKPYNAVCLAMDLFSKFQSISTVLHLLVISFERYATIVNPLGINAIAGKKCLTVVLSTLWLSSVLVTIIQLSWIDLSFSGANPHQQIEIIYDICLCVLVLAALFVMIFIYYSIFYSLRKQNRLIKRHTPQFQQTNVSNRVRKKEMRSALILSSMTITFITGWCFYFVLSLQTNLNLGLTIPVWFDYLSVIMHYLTGFINPLLYTFLKLDFVEEVSIMCCKFKTRRQLPIDRTSSRPISY